MEKNSALWMETKNLALISSFCFLAFLYTLYEVNFLPKPIAKVVGKTVFFPSLPFTYFSRRHNYWTLIDSHVFLGAVPLVFLGHINDIYCRGVRGVVNMLDEYQGPIRMYKKYGIQQLHLPTIDHTEPSLEDLIRGVEFINQHKDSGSRVYIHCKAGKGRSAALAFCWLLYSKRSLSLEEVQEILSERRCVRPNLFQQHNILQFYNYVQKHD